MSAFVTIMLLTVWKDCARLRGGEPREWKRLAFEIGVAQKVPGAWWAGKQVPTPENLTKLREAVRKHIAARLVEKK